MEGLQLSNAKLLYIVNELFKQGTISETEKATIKEKIVSDDPKVVELLTRFESNGDETILKDGILEILRPKEEIYGLGVVINKKTQDEPEQYEDSSPLGNKLLEIKKKHHTGQELQGLIKTIKPIN